MVSVRFRWLAMIALTTSACSFIVGLKDRELVDAGTDASSCDAAHQYFSAASGHCYEFVSSDQTWTVAEGDCNSKSDGGHLVSITSGAEQIFVAGIVSTEVGDAAEEDGRSPGIWIGLERDAAVDAYGWSTGEPLGFTNWTPGQPGGKPCVFEYGPVYKNQWDDFLCNVSAPYVCEW